MNIQYSKIAIFISIFLILSASSFCSDSQKSKEESSKPDMQNTGMILTSPAFTDGDSIPRKFTCSGANISPQLSWSGIPDNVKSFTLICDDPDAPRGTWVHWVVINIPPDISELKEAIKFDEDSTYAGTLECLNDFGRVTYGGPCPPPGPAHRYFFKLYALDKILDLTAQADKAEIEKAMNGHVLEQSTLMGLYQ